MPIFPSREWCEEAVRLANEDPESAQAASGWEGDLGVVVDAEPGKLARPFTVRLVPVGSRLEQVDFLDDPDELEELEPKYLARAPYSVWKALMQGSLDPIEAIVRRMVTLTGDVQPIIERVKFRGIADRVLLSIETRFIDDER